MLIRGDDIFAGTVKDLFKWDTASNAWRSMSNGIKNKNILSMGADPQGNILYAGSGPYDQEKGFFEKIPCLYKSTDRGKTWSVSDKGIPDGTLVYEITANPARPERVYLGASDGMYRSVDSGENWTKMEAGLPKDLRIFDIEIARMPGKKDVVYAAGSRGIFMTVDDDATSWTGKSYGLPPTNITGIVLLPDE